jgi:hypothetical protein
MESLFVTIGAARACQAFDLTLPSKGDWPVDVFFDRKTRSSKPLKHREDGKRGISGHQQHSILAQAAQDVDRL